MLDSVLMEKHLAALQSGPEGPRRQAVHWLRQQDQKDWETVSRPVLHSIVEALRHELAEKQPINRQTYRQEVAAALGSLGSASRPAILDLTELLEESVPDPVRVAAALALGQIGADDRRPAGARLESALVAFWLAPGQAKHVHLNIASALVRLRIDAEGLIGFLTSTAVSGEEVALRSEAVETLGWCAKQETGVVPALLTVALKDKQDDVRQQAEASLSRLGLTREQAVLLCARQLDDSDHAETALRHSGALAVPGLRQVLKTADARTQATALRTLSSLGEVAAAAVPEVTRALRDRDPELRLAAAKSLWNITRKPEGVVAALVGLLESERTARDSGDDRRRFLQTVIEALRRIGPPARDAVPALTRKTRDPNRLVSESAISALREITGANGAAGR
jgi:HEAT repeat protein